MSLLLHVCCAPCLIYPGHLLSEEHIDFTCYFFNPNIHPYKEFRRRLDTFLDYSSSMKFKVIVDRDYGLKEFLRSVVFRENNRCSVCYSMRLNSLAQRAVDDGFSSFSTTLLYSVYQNHNIIITEASRLASQYSIPFFYRDFRDGWQFGIDQSTSLNLYRQPYCGCIFSEHERYDNRLKKRLRKEKKHV